MVDLGSVWLFGHRSKSVDARLHAFPTAYRLYSRSIYDTTALLQLQLPLVALYKCYTFTYTGTCMAAGQSP